MNALETALNKAKITPTTKVLLPNGVKTEGYIKDGKTYLSNGSRIPEGSVVQTGGGYYKMENGAGIKVPSTTVILPNGSVQQGVVVNGVTYMPDGTRPPEGAIVRTSAGDYKMTNGAGVRITSSSNTGGNIVSMPNVSDAVLKLLPPAHYSPSGEWSTQDIKDFIAFEVEGKKLQWEGTTSELLSAKTKLESDLDELGWSITYNSAYRPLIYQAHFYDIKLGAASKTPEGKADAQKHGLAGVVAKPNPNAPHTAGIAFDAVVLDQNGKQMNGKTFVSPELLEIANKNGLDINVPNDYVHFQLQKKR